MKYALFPCRDVLVTGGAGAIGSVLVRRLLRTRVRRVIVLDDLSSGCRRELPIDPRVIFVKGDIADPRAVARAFKWRPQAVFHLAAHFANQNSIEHPVEDANTNIIGTILLLEASRVAECKRFVYISSSCVYADSPGPLAEERSPLKTSSTPYAIAKLAGEHYSQFYCEQYGLETVTLRLFNSYGPSEHPGQYRNVIPNFFALALKGKPLPITGTGKETRSFMFVEDSAEAILRSSFYPKCSGRIINIGNGDEARIMDLANRINALCGNAAGVVMKPRRSWDHVFRRIPDTQRMRTLLGMRSFTSFDAGLRRTHAWFTEEKRHLLG